jgi:hypothetical protein
LHVKTVITLEKYLKYYLTRMSCPVDI